MSSPAIIPQIALELTDELILKLVGGDENVHVAVIDNREKLEHVAGYGDTHHGSLLASILAYDEKFRRLPNWDTLRDFILTRYHSEIPLEEWDELKVYDPREILFTFDSLEILIDQIYEQFQSQTLIARLKRAELIALGNGWHDKKERLWKGPADAEEWLTSQLGGKLSEEYAPEPGEVELVSGRDKTAAFSVTAIPASTVELQAITWLWPERIPMGKMTLIAGKPDCGKSTVTLDIVARVTTGRDWPDGSRNSLGPRDVLMAIAEDDLNDTVVPRLNAAGADLSRIHFLNKVRVQDFGAEDSSPEVRSLQLSEDVDKVRQAVAANPKIALVVVDTITSYFGDVNTNADKDVRPVMDALAKTFRDCGACFLAVVHHNKRSDVDAVQKILGAASVAGAVRAAWGFSRDPDNKEEFYMARVKGNLSKKLGGMKYRVIEKTVNGIAAPCIDWLNETEETANEILDKERDTRGRKEEKQITLARAFLPVALENGPRAARELYKEAEAEGISVDQLKRAKYELDVRSAKKSDGWYWFIPGRPEPSLSLGDEEAL